MIAHHDESGPPEKWACSVAAVEFDHVNVDDSKDIEWLLYDSGSDEHLCGYEFGGVVPCVPSVGGGLRGVSG